MSEGSVNDDRGRGNAWRSYLFLFLLGLALRLLFAVRSSPVYPVWDGVFYHQGAVNIAHGLGYSELDPTSGASIPSSHYPVGLSALLSLFYRIFGASPLVGTTAMAILTALTPVAVMRLGSAFLSSRRAFVAGLLSAVHPTLVMYAGLLMTEPLAALGVVLVPLAFVEAKGRRTLGAVAAGVTLGLLVLVRPESILYAPLVGLLAGPNASVLEKSKLSAIATAATMVAVAPWLLRNALVLDAPAFVSTNGGWNLAIGASPHATGRYDPLLPEDGCFGVVGAVHQDRCWLGRGLGWMGEDPVRYLGRIGKKLAYTFDQQSFPVSYYREADPAAWPWERAATYWWWLRAINYAFLFAASLGMVSRETSKQRRVLAFAFEPLHLLVALAFALGLIVRPTTVWPMTVGAALVGSFRRTVTDRDAGLRWLTVVVLLLAFVHAVFFGEDRYQLIIVPVLAILAAAALSPNPTP